VLEGDDRATVGAALQGSCFDVFSQFTSMLELIGFRLEQERAESYSVIVCGTTDNV
jgi:hypothetical protein